MRTRSWVWFLVGGLGLFGLLCVGLLVVGGIWVFKKLSLSPYQITAATLPAERRAAKQAGILLGPQNLVRKPALPASQNAAPLYRKITQRFDAKPLPKNDEKSLIAFIMDKATEADRETTRKLLATYAPEIHLGERAAALPDCDFKRDWQLGYDVKFPEYRQARQLARLLVAQAIFQNGAGHPEEALNSITAIAHIGRHMGKDPSVIAMLVQIALEAIGDRAWQQIVKANGDKPAILRLAAQTDKEFGPLPDLKHAMRGEMVMGRVVLNNMRKGKWDDTIKLPRFASNQPRNIVVDAWEARYLAYWRQTFAVLNGPPRDPMQTYLAIKKISDAEQAQENRGSATYEINAILSPVFSEAFLKVVHCEAQRRLRRTLPALLDYRRRTGRFPDTLSALTPPAPLDPFVDQPLHYRRTASGFLLYSVGENLKDDGGDIQPKKKGGQPPDMGIAYP